MNLLEDIFLAILIIGIGGILTWAFLWWNALGTEPPEIKYAEGNIIQNNSLMSVSPLPFTPPVVLSALMERIIFCESTWNCEAKNPKSTAYGYCQFLDSTWEYVQKKWDIELDRNNPDEQLYACQRLLKEEGWEHWEASKSCWDK